MMKYRNWITAASLLFFIVASLASAQSSAWIELESSGAPDKWTLQSAVTGYSGTGYLFWEGPDILSGPPAASLIDFDFTVAKAGKYQFEIRSLRKHSGTCAGAENDHCNDVYTKVNGSAFIKTMARAPWDVWGWSDGVSPGGTTINKWQHELKAGANTLTLGARSRGIAVDAVRIYLVGATAPTGPDNPSALRPEKLATPRAQTPGMHARGRDLLGRTPVLPWAKRMAK